MESTWCRCKWWCVGEVAKAIYLSIHIDKYDPKNPLMEQQDAIKQAKAAIKVIKEKL